MNRFVYAGALALVGVLGFADSAHAQYYYGYNTFVPGVGVVGNRAYVTPFGARAVQQSYSPWLGLNRQAYYTDVFGNQTIQTNRYYPAYNLGYRSGYTVSPGGFVGPFYTPPTYGRYNYIYRR